MAPTPSTRATRSRFSSPMQSLGASGAAPENTSNGTGNANAGGSGCTSRPNAGGNSSRTAASSSGNGVTNAQKALMARWLEPPVQNRPSFEEAGFQRHGVFDGMAPLGSLPKPAILAKRLQSLPEEKLYSSINSETLPSPNPSSRQSAKQKQKEQREKRKSKSQQKDDDDDEGLDGPEAQQEQWRLEEEREQQLREAAEATKAVEAAERQRRQQEKEAAAAKREREQRDEKARLEDEERKRLQDEQPTPSKKIIIKRPSASRKPPTRIIVSTRRSRAAAETTAEAAAVADAPEEPVSPKTTKADTKSPPKRKRIFVSPKSKAAKAAEKPGERDGQGKDDNAEKEHSLEDAQASTKRPIGRPRSRRSIAAENRMLRKQEKEHAEAEAEVEAEIKAKRSPSPAAQPVVVEADVEAVQPATEDADKTIQDSEDDTGNGNNADNADNEADSDSEADYSQGGLVMDSSILPLIPLSSSFNVQRPHSDSNATVVNKEVTDHVVTVAVAEALRHGRYPTAWALRTLYDDHSGDQKFLTMVEDVFQQTADHETVKAFVQLVQDKKKEGKKDNQGWRHFVPLGLSSDSCLPGRPALIAPYADLLDLDFAILLDPKKAELWAMEREQRLEDEDGDAMTGLEDDADVFRSKSTTGEDEDADADADPADTDAPRKRLKLSTMESAERAERGGVSFASPHLPSASPAPALTLASTSTQARATSSHGPPISTFAAPTSATTSTPPTAIFGKPRAHSHARTASFDEQQSSPTKSSSTKDITAVKNTGKMPNKSIAPPKTPTKVSGRGPGRPLGSTKAKAAAASAAAKSEGALSQPGVTPGSSRRRPRTRATSSASSTSSLSSVMSLSPPGKTPLKSNANDMAVDDYSESSDEDVANGDNAVTHDSTGGLKTSVGWTIGTLQQAARDKKLQEEQDEHKKLKRERRASRKAAETPRPNFERPKSGPGSGRGGRRRGAGRPPKNRGNSHSNASAGGSGAGAGVGVGVGAGAGAGADAVTPSKAAAVNGPVTTAPSAPTTPTAVTPAAPAQQPIATRNRAAAKKSPTPSALISPSHSQPKNPQSHSASHPSHSHTDKSSSKPPPTRPFQSKVTPIPIPTPSRSQPKRSSATAAAAAISASAKEAEKARESQDSQHKDVKTSHEPKQAKGAADMPSAVQEHASVRSVAASKRARASTGLPSPAPASSAGGDESGDAAATEDRRARMRREARVLTNSMSNAPESYTRSEDAAASASTPTASGPSSRSKGNAASSASATVSTPPQNQRQRQLRASTTTARTTRSSRKRAFDEVEDEVSPRSASLQPDDAGLAVATPVSGSTRLQTPVPSQQAAAASRAGTPGPKSKKARVGPRVKTSPVKKKTGTFAGMPRLSGERGSPAGSIPLNQDDNDDYCASCGGSGDLVCCDGCTLSFHFQCVDPPLHEGRDLPDEWFCNNCISRHNPAALTRYTGLFGPLLNNMEQKNSSAFRLPAETRDYFEGVKTGADGEYETIVAAGANRTRKRAGYDEMFDFFRLRDFDNNLVLCHGCNHSAENPNKKNESGRPIIPCAFCSLWWHIDCLDPPLAQPPPIRNWRCPAHADDVLNLLPMLGPAHRFRKVKGAPVVKTAYSRGMVNNGFIEIASDNESDATPNNSGWKDPATFGRIQRVSAKSVQLDFMEFVRNERAARNHKGQERRDRLRRMQERPEYRAQNANQEKVATAASQNAAQATVPPPTQPIKSDPLLDRQFIDAAQAAHGLAVLSSGGDRTGELINALLQNAEPTMISLMAQSSPLNIENGPAALKSEDLVALQAMRARIDQLLGGHAALSSKASMPEPAHAEIAMEPASSPHGEADANEGNEEMSLVTDNGDSDMNEDEEPPAIATPSASVTVADEPAAACEGVAEADWAPTAISTGKEDVTPSFPHQHQHHLPPVRIDASKPDLDESAAATAEATTLPSPLTPPATSDVAADDDDENTRSSDHTAVSDPTQPASVEAETIDEEL